MFCLIFIYLFRLVSWWEYGTFSAVQCLVGFSYLKGLHSHKAFCTRQFVIGWGGLKKDQLQGSLLLIFTLSTSKPLPTLVKSQPSTWAICGSVTSLPDIKSRLNTNHRLEPFCLQYLPFPCCHESPIDFDSTNISWWWELTSFSCLFTHSVQSKNPVALFTLVYK